MKRHVCVFSSGAGCITWATKVNAVSRNECPIAVEDYRLQFPVLPTAFSDPGNMRSLCMTSPLSQFCQFFAQAFVHEQFHDAGFRRGLRRLETITTPAGNDGKRRGLPR